MQPNVLKIQESLSNHTQVRMRIAAVHNAGPSWAIGLKRSKGGCNALHSKNWGEK